MQAQRPIKTGSDRVSPIQHGNEHFVREHRGLVVELHERIGRAANTGTTGLITRAEFSPVIVDDGDKTFAGQAL